MFRPHGTELCFIQQEETAQREWVVKVPLGSPLVPKVVFLHSPENWKKCQRGLSNISVRQPEALANPSAAYTQMLYICHHCIHSCWALLHRKISFQMDRVHHFKKVLFHISREGYVPVSCTVQVGGGREGLATMQSLGLNPSQQAQLQAPLSTEPSSLFHFCF